MGAWIEMHYNDGLFVVKEVAPHMGAWIEITTQDLLVA